MKVCTTCRTEKDQAHFHKRSASPDGLALICRECSKEKGCLYYQTSREAAKARAKQWATKNPERKLEIRKRSEQKNIEKKRISSREYNKRRRIENPSAAREAGRRAAAIRRTREFEAGGIISTGMWNAIFAVFETNACVYCGVTDRKLTMDHWIPVSRGGRTEAGNLIPCCKPCNSRKGTKMPNEWLATMPSRDVGVSIEQFLTITAETAKLFHAIYGKEIVLS